MWTAAGAGIYGLSSWHRQRRGERLLKYAERALGSGQEAFMLIRQVRSQMISIPEEEASNPVRRKAFIRGQPMSAIEKLAEAAEHPRWAQTSRRNVELLGHWTGIQVFSCCPLEVTHPLNCYVSSSSTPIRKSKSQPWSACVTVSWNSLA